MQEKEINKCNSGDVEPLDTDKNRIENMMHKVHLWITNMTYHKIWQGQNKPCPHTTLHNSSGYELKLPIKSHKLGAKAPCKKWKNHLDCINCVFSMVIGTPFICHQWGPLTDVGMPSTWEKVVTYLLEPLDFSNLRDGHKPSQLPLPNQIFRILPLCIELTQGCLKCDRSHRDTRWISGLSHQSSNLSHLHNPLLKVVICACSNTGFEWHKVVNYPAN